MTNAGLAKLANAVALGQDVQWSQMAVGDGNGNPTTPTETQTALVRERYRAAINQLSTDPLNPNYIIAELVVPMAVGGWTVHEVGLFDADGVLVAVANFPATYKPILTEGSGKDLVVKIYIETANAASVELKIDPSIVLASRSWVVANFLNRSKVAGGTTGQVLTKTGNADEAFAWQTPGVTNITVNVVQELQTLAAGQLIVDLATVNTTGTAYYVGGARLEPSDYTVNSTTRITLARTYPAGTKILAAQNSPVAPTSTFTPTSGGGALANGGKYLITDNESYVLPSVAALTSGAFIQVKVAKGAAPTVSVQGGSSEQLRGGAVAPFTLDTFIQFDQAMAVDFTLNKTANFWEMD